MTEDPSREAWLHLEPHKARTIIQNATARYRKGERFKSVLIELLDKATVGERVASREKAPRTHSLSDLEAELARRKAAGEVFTE